jgi:hypothetical protein
MLRRRGRCNHAHSIGLRVGDQELVPGLTALLCHGDSVLRNGHMDSDSLDGRLARIVDCTWKSCDWLALGAKNDLEELLTSDMHISEAKVLLQYRIRMPPLL